MTEKIVKVIDLIPGESLPLHSIDARSLSCEDFWDHFVSRHEPVILRGAAISWPAFKLWRKLEYIESVCGDGFVWLARSFNFLPSEAYYRVATKRKRFRECVAEMQAAPDDLTFSIAGARLPESLKKDIGSYSFISKKHNKKPLVFKQDRLFLYKNASTDWHYHITDETITTQLKGAKDVALFRLDISNWAHYSQSIEANLHHLPGGNNLFPEAHNLQKYEGRLEPGDSLYIPPFWWHGVDPVESDWGVTLAHCFRTPLKRLADWCEPIVREEIKDVFSKRKYLFPFLIALVSLSVISRKLANEPWYFAGGPKNADSSTLGQ